MRSHKSKRGFRVSTLAYIFLLPAVVGSIPALAQTQTQAASSAPLAASAPDLTPGGGQDTAAPAMSKADVLKLLYRIYDQSYHFGDAVAKLPAADWKFGGRKRQVFYQTAATVRASITELSKSWDEFYKQPDDAELGRKTLSAVHTVTTQMSDFIKALGDTPGASEVQEFEPIETAVRDSEQQLEPYVKYLQASAKEASKSETAAAPAQPAPPAPAEAQPSAPASNPQPAAPAPVFPSATPEPSAPAQPSAEAAAPSSANASNAPAPAPAAAPAQPAVTPVAMEPTAVQALLYKIYMANFRIGDLAGSLQPDKWNLSGQDQAAVTSKLDALRSAVATAEKSRGAFYAQPNDAGLAQSAASDLRAVAPDLDDLVAALRGTPGAASASQFKQAGDELSDLNQGLAPYVAWLAAKSQPPPAPGGVALETENVNPGENVAPLSSGVVETAPEDEQQVKTLLYKAYVPAFRLKDMLAQENPDKWQAPQADRTAFSDASKMLSDRITELEKWRDQFGEHPYSLEAAFEAYASLGKLVEPADVVGRLVGEYGNAKVGAEYGQRAQEVEESRDQLEPYLDYLLRHHDNTTGAIERDFVACETQLSYAMRPSVQQPAVMKNINPVFQGRGRRTERGRAEAKKKTPAQDKNKKTPAPAPH